VKKLARDKALPILEAIKLARETAVVNAMELSHHAPYRGKSIRQILTELDGDHNFLVRLTDEEINRIIRKEQDDIDHEANMSDEEFLAASIAGELGL
jgi:hypothetical protein